MGNVRFKYLYRDGSNYKKCADMVFSNPDGLNCETLVTQFTRAFLEDGQFIAHQIRIPEVFLWNASSVDFDDHCFHEFSGIEDTGDTPNDRLGRSIREFADEVTLTAMQGWNAFDPSERAYLH